MAAKTTNSYAIVKISKATGTAEVYKRYATEKGAASQAAKRNAADAIAELVYLDMPAVAANNIIQRFNSGELEYDYLKGELVEVPKVEIVEISENLIAMMRHRTMHIAASWQKVCTKMYGEASVAAALAS